MPKAQPSARNADRNPNLDSPYMGKGNALGTKMDPYPSKVKVDGPMPPANSIRAKNQARMMKNCGYK